MNKNNPDQQNDKRKARKLAKYEKRIEKAQRAQLMKAVALLVIHDEGLYPDDTFEAYVERRWGFTVRRAYHLLEWAKLYHAMEARGHARLPLTESEARPLTKLKDPVAEDAVWSTVLDRRADDVDKPVTRAEVESEVDSYLTAMRSLQAEDGGVRVDNDMQKPLIVLPGRSPLVESYGPIDGEPPALKKSKGSKSDGLLVAVPGTLVPSPTSKIHLVTKGQLPFPLTAQNTKMTAKNIEEMKIEFERIGVVSAFNITNASVDWARYTWNPITGCIHDCVFCYARDLAIRHYDQGFAATFYPNRLAAPSLTEVPSDTKPGEWMRRVFVGSMGDLFALSFPDAAIQSIIDAMAAAPQWTFLLLTKLPKRLRDFTYPPNVWVGTTVVDQASARRAEAAMKDVEATVKWVSLEPLLGPVQFEDPSIFDWFVIGSQTKTWSVKDMQPDPAWVYDLLIQAAKGGVEVFMKENLSFWIRRSPGDPKS